MVDLIKKTIVNTIPNSTVYVFGEDGEHFQAIVISEIFSSLPLVKQHQLVMNSLKKEFNSNTVHALSLKTFTPEKWDINKSNYNLDLAK
jgi:acid stress-induced BolA-like protein IbaG/YrbA